MFLEITSTNFCLGTFLPFTHDAKVRLKYCHLPLNFDEQCFAIPYPNLKSRKLRGVAEEPFLYLDEHKYVENVKCMTNLQSFSGNESPNSSSDEDDNPMSEDDEVPTEIDLSGVSRGCKLFLSLLGCQCLFSLI